MKLDRIHPASWKQPSGYSTAILARDLEGLLFVSGQIAWDEQQRIVGKSDFTAQFRQALANVCAVVRCGGAHPSDIVRLTMYVTDKRLYLDRLKELGAVYRDLMGSHYPAMALVQVAALVEDDALIEIEATAAVG